MARSRTANQESGFTVLEAAVAMGMLAVALLSLWGTLVYCSRSNVAAEQKKRAMNAAQAKIEELKSVPFTSLVTDYGKGGKVGNLFHVTSLDDEQSGAEGQIVFYTDETDTTTDPTIGPVTPIAGRRRATLRCFAPEGSPTST